MSELEAKNEAKDRDGNECQFCGVTNEQHNEEYGRSLHAHHILPKRAGGEDHTQNLITVCRSCHTTLEHTQAEALSQIQKNEKSVSDLKEENTHLRQELNEAIDQIHQLERYLREPKHLAKHLENSNIYFESVAERFGERTRITTDKDLAEESYREWGSVKKKERIRIREQATNILTEALEKFNERRLR